MSSLLKPFLSPEDYLVIERAAERKSEYYKGEMFAMSGVTMRHDRIVMRLLSLLDRHLSRSGCEVHTSDLRVHVASSDLYTYPDASVVCGEPAFLDSHLDTLTNPILLVEVLSPSTERYDRIAKVAMYRAIPSLRECLLIAQDQRFVTLHRKGPDGNWSILQSRGLDATIELTSINYTLRLDELYETALPRE